VKHALVALLLSLSLPAQAEVQVFEQAEMAYGYWYVAFPDRPDAWTPVTLPQNFWKSGLMHGTHAWYRIRFDLEQEPWGGLSLYFPKVRLYDFAVYVNSERIWRLSENYGEGLSISAVRIPIRSGLLRRGDNTMLVWVSGYSRWYHGMSRVYLGPSRVLTRHAAVRSLLQNEIRFIVAATFGAIGVLCLWLWLRVVRDPVLFWYGVAAVTLLVATAAWYAAQWGNDQGWRLAMIFMRYHGYLVPIFILHLRLAGRKHLWLEGALWIVLVYALLTVSRLDATAWTYWSLAFATAPALLTIPLIISPHLRTRPSVILLIVADIAACLLPLHDWAWRLGFIDFDRPFLAFYGPAFVMLAAAVPIIERVQAGIRAGEKDRLELERRVADKTREIESSHERLRQAQREAALAEERRRIMADMHDGLGARLVALLSVAQSGKAKHGEITEGLAAALDELRLTVDSVQPVEGDVGVVLGNVRHRMRSVFERSGIKLNWNVSELPRMEDLTSERILAIQRIFLEAFSNAIRHSGARTVSVFTMRVPGAVRIVIEDDGRGFDAEGTRAGNGLANLRLRAEQAGGAISVESTPGKGTRVTLSLPVESEGTPEPLPNTGQEPADYPLRGMAADPASS
jgi:signal transduction histidine kinase